MKRYLRLSEIKWPFLLFGTLVCLAALLVSPRMLAGDPQLPSNANNGLPPPYNPYPFGILPSDLNSEIERVRREAAFIEQEAIAEWQALPPLMLTSQPPTFQGSRPRSSCLGNMK